MYRPLSAHCLTVRSSGCHRRIDVSTSCCGGCGGSMEGSEAIFALGSYFHKQCFKCTHCSEVIGTKFSTREGKPIVGLQIAAPATIKSYEDFFFE